MRRWHLPQLGLMPRRVAVDAQPDAILWAESVWRPGGRRLRACGCEPRGESEKPAELLQRFAARAWLRHAEVSVAIRHPEIELTRLELPAMSDRDALRIGERRARELCDRIVEPASHGHLLAAGKGPRPVWLLACPEEFAGFAEQRWRSQGLPVSHFGCAHVALGSLARALAPPPAEELRAILDVAPGHAICVLVDGEGWVFSREIPIKISRAAQDGDGADSIERLGKELRRTFRYASSELRAGDVSQLLVSGTRSDLGELTAALADELELDVRPIGDAIVEGPAAGVDPALALVVGLALEPNLGSANLLPHASRLALARRQLMRRLAAAALLPVLLLTIGGAWGTSQVATLTKRADALSGEWTTSSALRARTEERTREWNRAAAVGEAVEASRPEQPPWSAVLRSLGTLLPDRAFVSMLEARRGENGWATELRIEFQGADLATAARAGSDFGDRLDGSPLWQVYEVTHEKTPPGRSGRDPDPGLVRARFRFDARLAPLQRDAGRSHG
jgi:Tfp pilus assembly protein PilN